jgi:hypothetical protein
VTQYSLLQGKLKAAVTGSISARLRLQRLEDDGLLLKVEVPLPAPLPPLKWPFFLSRAPQRAFTQELLLPLLGKYLGLAEQIESLLSSIKEKDHVINKLVDKADSSGMRVCDVFPSAQSFSGGRKELTWNQAAGSIRGLRAFDEAEWRKTALTNSEPHNITDALRTFVQGSECHDKAKLRSIENVIATGEWWKVSNADVELQCEHLTSEISGVHGGVSMSNLGAANCEEEYGVGVKAATGDKYGAKEGNADDDEDDEFEEQNSLPLKRPPGCDMSTLNPMDQKPTEVHGHNSHEGYYQKNAGSANKMLMDTETLAEDAPSTGSESALPLAKSADATRQSSTKAAPKRLGAIGGKKASKAIASEVPLGASEMKPSSMSRRTEGSIHAPNQFSVEEMKTQALNLAHSKPHSRLGRIGGRKNSEEVAREPVAVTGDSDHTDAVQPTLEKIDEAGMTFGRSQNPGPVLRPSPGEVKSDQDKQHDASQTSALDAADERREQLKRQLQQRQQAKAKRTRKF